MFCDNKKKKKERERQVRKGWKEEKTNSGNNPNAQ